MSTAHMYCHTAVHNLVHLTAHSFGVQSSEPGKGAFTVGVVEVEVGTYLGGSGYAVGLTRR